MEKYVVAFSGYVAESDQSSETYYTSGQVELTIEELVEMAAKTMQIKNCTRLRSRWTDELKMANYLTLNNITFIRQDKPVSSGHSKLTEAQRKIAELEAKIASLTTSNNAPAV